VPREPLVPQLADALRRNIVLGLLGDYARLPAIPKLAKLFGVSVGTMRQALQVLAYLGVVRLEHGAGTFVMSGPGSHRANVVALRRASVLEMTNLRRLLEVESARSAARRETRAAFIDARDRLLPASWERRFGRRGRPDDYLRSDLEFHAAVLMRSGDAFAAALHAVACKRLTATLRGDAARQRADDHLDELHDQLVDAIEAHQPEYAARLAREIAEREAPKVRGAR
jgi:DNA-binding FadR family transcriptional regulator